MLRRSNVIRSIILAAGRGRRLGGPKALLVWPMLPQRWLVPLAVAHVEARAEQGPVWVVTRQDIATALRRHAPLSFSAKRQLLVSERPDALGPAGSIAAAAEVVPRDGPVLITPVDCPPASAAVVMALLEGLRGGGRAARPLHLGRGGHPVLIEGALLGRFVGSQPPPLRDLLRELGDDCVDVEVDDPTVRIDIDDEADLARWSKTHGAGLVDAPRFFEP